MLLHNYQVPAMYVLYGDLLRHFLSICWQSFEDLSEFVRESTSKALSQAILLDVRLRFNVFCLGLRTILRRSRMRSHTPSTVSPLKFRISPSLHLTSMKHCLARSWLPLLQSLLGWVRLSFSSASIAGWASRQSGFCFSYLCPSLAM